MARNCIDGKMCHRESCGNSGICEESLGSAEDMLFGLKTWLEYKLHTSVAHVPVEGNHPRGWCAVQIPDWDVKQKLAEIDALLKAVTRG